MTIKNLFNITDTVFLVHDPEEIPRMITAIIIRANGFVYELSSGEYISCHCESELKTGYYLHQN